MQVANTHTHTHHLEKVKVRKTKTRKKYVQWWVNWFGGITADFCSVNFFTL